MPKIVYRYNQGGKARANLEPPQRDIDLSWLRAFVDAAVFIATVIFSALMTIAAYNLFVILLVRLISIFP